MTIFFATTIGVAIVAFIVWINIVDRKEKARRRLLPPEEQARLKLEDDIWLQTW